MGKAKGRRKSERATTAESQALVTGETSPAERHDFTAGGLLGHDSGEYHVNVSERTALGIDAVIACVLRLGDAISGADVGEWRGSERLSPEHPLVVRPTELNGMFRGDWLWHLTSILALYTVCPIRRFGIRGDGSPLALHPIVPTRLSPAGRDYLLDGEVPIRRDELIFARRAVWPTLSTEMSSILRLAREVFAAAWAQAAYTADFWENGGAPIIQITTDQEISNPQADAIRDRWSEARRDNPGKPAVFGKGASAKPFGVDLAAASDPGADRLLASVARFLGVQPWLINAPSAAGSMVYTNSQESGLDLVRYTLSGYRRPIEDAWSDAIPGNYLTGRRVRLGLDHLSMPGWLERAQGYAVMTGDRPWMDPSEVRPAYGLPPRPQMDLDPAGAPAPALELIPGG